MKPINLTKKFTCFIIVALYTICSSCYRPSGLQPPGGTPVFTITGSCGSITDSIVNFYVRDSEILTIDLAFGLTSGNPKDYPITCFVSGLPTGVHVNADSQTFQLNYHASFSAQVTTDTGSYTFYINVRTPKDGVRSYPAHLHVLQVADGSASLTGTYTGKDPCGHFSEGDVWYNYDAVVATVQGKPHWISITNFRGLGDSISVFAFVSDNSDGTNRVDIPEQTIKGYTFLGRGKGYYGLSENNKPFIYIYGDTVINAGDTQTCFTQLNRK